jgi:hypothetical protein
LERRAFTYIALAMLVWAISGTATAGYYFTQYTIYHNEYRNLVNEFNALSYAMGNISGVMESVSLRINILVSYGNGTKIWHNNTALPVGSTAFTSILAVADIRYKDYGGDLGILVTSVNGLTNSSTCGWSYWYRDIEKSEWVLPEYSCAKYILHRGDTIAFTYASWPPPPPS